MSLNEGHVAQGGGVSSCEALLFQEAATSETESTTKALNATEDASSEPCELDKPEYKTDEFRLYQFKIQQCCNQEPHDWCLCPFAHPGEKAQRRDPRLFKYTGISCPDYRKGTCKRGNACPYAHGVFEVWLHPSRYRTQTCKDAPHCTRQVCFFAHTLEELRTVEPEDLPGLTDDVLAGMEASEAAAAADAAAAAAGTSTPVPKCGCNTNAKAAAAAKAKAAAAAAAATAANEGSSTASSCAGSTTSNSAQNGSSLLEPWSMKQHMSRQPSNCSTATTASQLAGLESLHSLGTPGLSLLNNASPLGMQQTFLQGSGMAGLLASTGGGGNRMLHVPTDIALEAAALRAAAAAAAGGAAQLCDTFGSLDLSTAAAAGAAAGPALDAAAFGAAASGLGSWASSAAAAASMGLPVLHLSPADSLDSSVGQFAGSALNNLAFAAAAHQAVAAQHRDVQDLLQSVLLHQQQLASMQHRDAMWQAAYHAAADVGLNHATAAACADAAVQNTTAAAAAAAAVAPAVQANHHHRQQQQQQQQQVQLQQLLAAQQQQQHHVAASVPMGMLPSALHMDLLASSSVPATAAAAPLKPLGNYNALDHLQQQQQQFMASDALLMQQANMLALHCDAFGGNKLAGLVGHLPGAMGSMQMSVAAGGGTYAGLQ